jgi:hypothetical protein
VTHGRRARLERASQRAAALAVAERGERRNDVDLEVRILIVEQIFQLLTGLATITQAGQRAHGRAAATRRNTVARALDDRVERGFVA